MGIDLNVASLQSQRARVQAVKLNEVCGELEEFQDNVNTYWAGAEMLYINEEIESIIRKINDAKLEIENICGDITSVAKEIDAREKEELAEEARKKEAAENEKNAQKK